MLFSSYEFLLVFLPAAWLSYVAVGRKSQYAAIGVLLAFSLAFYAWWSSAFLLLLIGSVSFNFLIGTVLSDYNRSQLQFRKHILILSISANLGLLAYFKYADFLANNISALFGWTPSHLDIILPMGISFYTFTQIAFLVDAHRREAQEYRPLHYGLFVTYFPHLIAGPILHHKEMMPQFSQERSQARITSEHLCLGFGFLAIGLFKKLAIADILAGYAAPVFDAAAAPTFIEAWIAALAYTFQLYFDFSGYSDMAIGISLLFGIWLPLNFDSPYKSLSIAEFWRRWHMTLSRFLRDYLYIPLGGSRNGGLARSRNLLITMLLGGLWHGAGWTFIAWGALHGIFLIINHWWRDFSSHLTAAVWRSGIFRCVCWVITFLCVIVGWVLFRSPNLDVAASILQGMAGLNGLALPERILTKLEWLPSWVIGSGPNFAYPDLSHVVQILLLVAAIVFLFPNTQQLLLGERKDMRKAKASVDSLFLRIPPYPRALVTAIIALVAIGHISTLSPFLYFQF